MQAQEYTAYVNRQLERLLVYQTVFKEYIHTCRNIEKGNCLASESLTSLRDYFSRNLLRFNRFIDECTATEAPAGYKRFNRIMLDGLRGVQQGASEVLMAIEPQHVDHQLLERGQAQQEQARMRIDSAFSVIEAKAM